MLSFMRNLLTVKAEKTMNDAIRLMVQFDPASATEAELKTLEQNLDRLGLQVQEAKAAFDKERREAETIVALRDQRIRALEILEAQMNSAADDASRTALHQSLEKQAAMIEGMEADVQREIAEAHDAHDFLEQISTGYTEAMSKLKTARARLQAAVTKMKQSEIERTRAEEKAKAASAAAGLSQVSGGLDIALSAMERTAEQNKLAAAAAVTKATLLLPTSAEQDDPHIAAAMAAAQGQKPTLSLESRLASIKALKSPADVPRLTSG